MDANRRKLLLAELAHLDQEISEAEQVVAETAGTDDQSLAIEVRNSLLNMRAKVEEKLDAGTP